MGMAVPPSGTFTFLFTDIEGSAVVAQRHPEAMSSLLSRHHAILNEAITAHNGRVFQIIGDAFCAAFQTANDALNAALSAQGRLQQEAWSPSRVNVRRRPKRSAKKLVTNVPQAEPARPTLTNKPVRRTSQPMEWR